MYLLRALIIWGWAPVVITALAVIGYLYELPMLLTLSAIGVVLVVGLIIAGLNARDKELENASLKLKDLAGYFNRRFTGNSSLSIFNIISSATLVENSTIWEWARSCGTCQRIFDSWCASFIARAETDFRTRMYSIYLRKYINELWLISTHYYEFIEQFYEITTRYELHTETLEQYHRFVIEYNAFVQNLQDNISELRKMRKTEVEPPSVRMAKELSGLIRGPLDTPPATPQDTP